VNVKRKRKMKTIKNTQYKKANITRSMATGLLTAAMLLIGAQFSKAQLTPFQATYFQNRYLSNPAMAGFEQGLNINLGYRQQWNTFPGAPKIQTLTADYQASDKVGLGLNVNSEQAGLIQTTRVMATYAYHIPLNGQDQKLSFGLSFGLNDPHLDNSNINGDQTDVQTANYNQLKAYVDGDFGMAYTSNHLIVEGAIPNLKAAFFTNNDTRIDVDRTTFMAAASYRIYVVNDYSNLTIEPKVAFRGVKGYDNIVDVGTNFTINNLGLNFSGVYHSSDSIGFGLGLIQNAFDINLVYNFETGPVRSYTAGAFELGVRLKLSRKK
jgi:type IX secretion system PorP/SprF family membrane protein